MPVVEGDSFKITKCVDGVKGWGWGGGEFVSSARAREVLFAAGVKPGDWPAWVAGFVTELRNPLTLMGSAWRIHNAMQVWSCNIPVDWPTRIGSRSESAAARKAFNITVCHP